MSNSAERVEEAAATQPIASETSKDLGKLSALLSSVDWETRVGLVQKNTGLPLGQILKDPNMTMALGSVGTSFGHKTLAEFITSPKEQLGLGMEWSDWADLVEAKCLKMQFNVSSDDHKEIINQVREVEERLGRKPVSPEEFYSVRQDILNTSFEKELDVSRQEIDRLENKIKVLNSRIEEMRTRHQELDERNRAISSDLEEAYTSKREMLSKLQEELVAEREEALAKLSAELNTKHSNEIASLKQKYASSIATQRARAQEQLAIANNRAEQAKLHYEEVEAKLSKQLEELRHELSIDRSSGKERSNQIDILNERIERLSGKLEEKESAYIAKCAELDRVERHAAGLESQLEKYLEENKGILLEDVKALEFDLSAVTGQYEDAKKKLVDVRSELEIQVKKNKKIREQLDAIMLSAEESSAASVESRKNYQRIISLLSLGAGALFLTNLAVAAFALF